MSKTLTTNKTKVREYPMRKSSFIEFGNLIEAASKSSDEFKNDLAPITSPMVKRALDAQKAQDEEKTQAEILKVLGLARKAKDQTVTNLRSYRKMADQQKAKLEKIEKAEKFGMTNGDFRPLLSVLGFEIEGYDASAWVK